MKTLLIIPYYGHWPEYFRLFIESCRNNENTLDICVISDNKPPLNLPSNIKFINYSFEDLKTLISKRIGLDIPKIVPYKLCDYRPAYGVIFNDLIDDYAFWGYCDIDLVFGNQSYFLREDILNSYDIISFKKGHLQGPFTIFRNNEYINTLFKSGEYYKEVFTKTEYCSFDEFGPNLFYIQIKSKEEILLLPDDNISVIAFKKEFEAKIKIYNEQHVKEELSTKEILVFKNGCIVDSKSNMPYFFFHWVLDKRNIWFRYPAWGNNPPNQYFITSSGFYSCNSIWILRILHYKNILIGLTYWWFLKITNYIKRRVGIDVVLDTYPKIGWVKRLK